MYINLFNTFNDIYYTLLLLLPYLTDEETKHLKSSHGTQGFKDLGFEPKT